MNNPGPISPEVNINQVTIDREQPERRFRS